MISFNLARIGLGDQVLRILFIDVGLAYIKIGLYQIADRED